MNDGRIYQARRSPKWVQIAGIGIPNVPRVYVVLANITFPSFTPNSPLNGMVWIGRLCRYVGRLMIWHGRMALIAGRRDLSFNGRSLTWTIIVLIARSFRRRVAVRDRGKACLVARRRLTGRNFIIWKAMIQVFWYLLKLSRSFMDQLIRTNLINQACLKRSRRRIRRKSLYRTLVRFINIVSYCPFAPFCLLVLVIGRTRRQIVLVYVVPPVLARSTLQIVLCLQSTSNRMFSPK